MPIKLNSAGGGSVTINAASTASATVLTVPATNANLVTTGDSGSITQTMLGTGVAGNGPAFSAYGNGGQALSASTPTKIAYQNELFDTANCFDSTTNYRFTPNVAGYYQINAHVGFAASSASGYAAAVIYKNGSSFQLGNQSLTNNSVGTSVTVNSLIYLNGSTDYLEIYAYLGGVTATTTATFITSNDRLWFNGFLARSA